MTAAEPGTMAREILPIRTREAIMLLVVALILFLLFFGLGFVSHLLWLGLILALIIGIVHMFTRSSA
ncbi:MAG TPA: hypothetical protein VK662_11300 [Acidothermaceae bacterium]|nr:hypothetical protein [Acidothermaceae bacterium]